MPPEPQTNRSPPQECPFGEDSKRCEYDPDFQKDFGIMEVVGLFAVLFASTLSSSRLKAQFI
jgi:hypothetical protein